jgi:hypothetical protein
MVGIMGKTILIFHFFLVFKHSVTLLEWGIPAASFPWLHLGWVLTFKTTCSSGITLEGVENINQEPNVLCSSSF